MDYHYLKDIPVEEYLFDKNTAIVTQNVFDRLLDYTRSLPTGPRPDFIYKKNSEWDYKRKKVTPCWWVFYCIRDPQDHKFVLHIPRRLLVI